MHIVIAVLGAIAAVYFFIIRARNAAEMTNEIVDAANDVRLAARRFGFRTFKNRHPVEGIEDPNIAIATIANAFLELEGLPSREQQNALLRQMQTELRLSLTDAEELLVLGRWMQGQCGGASPAISRAARKLHKLQGAAALTPLMPILKESVLAASQGLSERQKEALQDIKNAFHIR